MKQKIVILGAGESGVGAAILAASMEQYDVFVSDCGNIKKEYEEELLRHKIPYEKNKHSENIILSANKIVKSPGIPDNIPLLNKARHKGISVISEIQFAYWYASGKIIAITGTNGKTTTANLTYHLLKKAGYDVGLAGNVGNSFARMVAEEPHMYYVLEISSFQLDGITDFKSDIAVILNITPDHLDRYGSMEKYIASKFRITQNLSSKQTFIYFSDNIHIKKEIKKRNIEASMFAISLTDRMSKGSYMVDDHIIFKLNAHEPVTKIPVSDISLIGKHNLINSMAASMSALFLGAKLKDIITGLRTFQTVPHRLEVVEVISGIRFINDSKATNVDSVFYALDGIDNNIIWIAGGIDKGNDYDQLDDLVAKKVKTLICLGKDNDKLIEHFQGFIHSIYSSRSMEEAVQSATENASPGDVILLSPACASFDLFDNYEERGEAFRMAAKKIKYGFNTINEG